MTYFSKTRFTPLSNTMEQTLDEMKLALCMEEIRQSKLEQDLIKRHPSRWFKILMSWQLEPN